MAKEKAYTRRVSSETEKVMSGANTNVVESNDLLFGKKNFTFILIGVGLIFRFGTNVRWTYAIS